MQTNNFNIVTIYNLLISYITYVLTFQINLKRSEPIYFRENTTKVFTILYVFHIVPYIVCQKLFGFQTIIYNFNLL